MFDAAYQGLMGILEPWAFFLMVSGVLVSSLFAALPGVGALLVITVILPYSFTLTPYGVSRAANRIWMGSPS